MSKIDFKEIPKKKVETNQIPKNQIYKIVESIKIPFVEEHEDHKEIVYLDYQLEEKQYGLYANEFRGQFTVKDGCKKADVLACVVDDRMQKVYTLIFDVKSNISAFSDDLNKDNAIITAVKEVRDFIEQIHDSIIHKESFMIYLKDEGYAEELETAIVTKNFENTKFKEVADYLEKISSEKDIPSGIPKLTYYKQQTLLMPYKTEVHKLRKFSERKLLIGTNEYNLTVYLLEKASENDYTTTVPLSIAI